MDTNKNPDMKIAGRVTIWITQNLMSVMISKNGRSPVEPAAITSCVSAYRSYQGCALCMWMLARLGYRALCKFIFSAELTGPTKQSSPFSEDETSSYSLFITGIKQNPKQIRRLNISYGVGFPRFPLIVTNQQCSIPTCCPN